MFFCTYDTLKKTIPLPSDYAPLTHMIAASLGEVVRASQQWMCLYLLMYPVKRQAACSIRVPTEVIKTRTQTSTYGSAAQSSLAAARLVLSTEGIRGFYRGFGSTIMREVCAHSLPPLPRRPVQLVPSPQIPFTSLQFPLYELLKLRLAKALHRPLHAYEAAVCGSFAGGVAAALTTPLDVLKTRVMLDLRVRVLSLTPQS